MKNVKTKLIYRTGRKFHNVSSCEDTHKCFFVTKRLQRHLLTKWKNRYLGEIQVRQAVKLKNMNRDRCQLLF